MAGLNPLSAALVDAALSLGVPLEFLQAQLFVGDLLAATVLAPQNGQDLIQILGQRVAAQLPADVFPGETLLLQVTGFAGNQILVHNLGLYDPQHPVPVVSIELPQTNAQSAVLTSIRSPQQSPVQAQPTTQEPPAQEPVAQAPQSPQTPIAPPRAVFVAASVRPAEPAIAAQLQEAPQSPQVPQAPPVPDIEARIAAAQTTKAAPPALKRAPPAPPIAAAPAAPRILPAIARKAAALLPQSPLARTAAAIASLAPARLPAVLVRLDAALPPTNVDPRIATLRTIAAFVARIDPKNEETMPAQISAYVSHVLEGSEPKLGQLLQALQETHAPQAPEGSIAPALQQSLVQAQLADRSAAIGHDLKSLVLSLLRNPPAGRTPALTQALNETLVTLTGTQLGVLSSNLQNPGTITFGLPVFFREGGKPAHIRISRDARAAGAPLDADNFHIAFVLETANLGVVALDLQTSGRAVSIDVKTEEEPAAERFAQSLNALRARLESLRYRVASASAGVAVRADAANVAAGEQSERSHGVDLRA